MISSKWSVVEPLVSVLIPVYNCEKYLHKAVYSILNQTYKNLEVLICDDGSTDSSLSILKRLSDSRVTVLKNSKNQGYLETVNKMFHLAKGQLITFQDADDWSHSERIAYLVRSFENDPSLLLCGSFCEKHTVDGGVRLAQYPVSDEKIRCSLSKGETALFCGASLMIRRDVLGQVGVYDSLFTGVGAEHIDWYLRILQQGKCMNIPKALYFYRQHGDSFTQTSNSKVNSFASDVALALHMFREAKGYVSLKNKQKEYLRRQFNLLNSSHESPGGRVKSLAFYGNYSQSYKVFLSEFKEGGGRSALFASVLVAVCYVMLRPIVSDLLIRRLVSIKRKKRAAQIASNLFDLG